MAAARVIVLERSSKWAVALRWSLAGTGIQVHSSSVWEDCRGDMEASPHSILLVEVTAELPLGLAHCLETFSDLFPAARWIALGSEADEATLWMARELGAVAALSSSRNLTNVVRLIRCHLQIADGPSGGFRNQVWQRMPLRDYESVNRSLNSQ